MMGYIRKYQNANSWMADNRARHQAMGGTAGPHATNVANKVDPLVDSDLGSYFPIITKPA
jgi:hypothetical protein